ncbi:TetR/AcrR family transcriptional regulator [Rhodococcoides yunnanense]|uniref:TetR/AcrR family transcriptional regulator n=1 Tax=Rhodococcoides yunnanense TaxID=278209 RepID=UPI000934FA90|nr:TetR/AcrR family transcriptional regulator [Rhodococcus yunnanensis]
MEKVLPTGEPRRRDAVATRAALLTAARSLIGRRGIDNTSTREVALVAGVNQALVYRYFGSREKLIVEALGSGSAELLDTIAAVDSSEIPGALLRGILQATTADDGSVSSLSTLATSAHNDALRPVIRQRIEALTESVSARLDEPDSALRAELLVAVGIGVAVMREKIGTHALVDADDATLHEYVDRMCALLVADGSPRP